MTSGERFRTDDDEGQAILNKLQGHTTATQSMHRVDTMQQGERGKVEATWIALHAIESLVKGVEPSQLLPKLV